MVKAPLPLRACAGTLLERDLEDADFAECLSVSSAPLPATENIISFTIYENRNIQKWS